MTKAKAEALVRELEKEKMQLHKSRIRNFVHALYIVELHEAYIKLIDSLVRFYELEIEEGDT